MKTVLSLILGLTLCGCGGGGKEPQKIGESCPSGLVLTQSSSEEGTASI